MELYQLKCFLLVAENENITTAADKLYISQSALSRVIMRLESELGVPLFDRAPKRIALNDTGRLFYLYLSHAKSSLDKAMNIISSAKLGYSETISIMCCLIQDFSTTFLDVCQEQFPNIKFDFSLSEDKRFDSGAIDRLPDLAISPAKSIDGMVPEASFPEKWLVICNRNYFSHLPQYITLKELSEQPVFFCGTDDDEQFVNSVFEQHGLTFHLLRIKDMHEAGAMINKRLGVGLTSNLLDLCRRNTGSYEDFPTKCVRISEDPFVRKVYLYRREDFPRSEETRAAMDLIRKQLAVSVSNIVDLL